jgi:laccase
VVKTLVNRDVQVQMANMTRLCRTKSIATVNGQLPGPEIIANEGDRVHVRVTNNIAHNMTIHWYARAPLTFNSYTVQCSIYYSIEYIINTVLVSL